MVSSFVKISIGIEDVAHRFLAFSSSRLVQWIMVFPNMQPKEMFCRKVPTAFRTTVGVKFRIMDLELFKGRK